MVESNLPFDRDRFLRDLPELLCGREPILDRPVARRWMRESPEGRRAVREIVSAVATLEDAPTRIVGASYVDIRSARSVELAAKHYPVRLASALRDLLNYDLVNGAFGRSGNVVLIDSDRYQSNVGRNSFTDRVEVLVGGRSADVDRASNRDRVAPVRAAIRAIDPVNLLSVIRSLDACPNDEYAYQLLAHCQGHRVDIDKLNEIVRGALDLDVSARAATMCSMLHGDASEYGVAVDAANFGVKHSVHPSAAAYNGLLYSILGSRERDAGRFLDILEKAMDLTPGSSESFRMSFLGDAKCWRVVASRSPALLSRVMTILGSAS